MILKATTKTSSGKMNKMGKQLSLPSARRNLKQERIGSDTLRFELGTYLDQKEKLINSDFVYKELILFSMADLQRSIPSITSGEMAKNTLQHDLQELESLLEQTTVSSIHSMLESQITKVKQLLAEFQDSPEDDYTPMNCTKSFEDKDEEVVIALKNVKGTEKVIPNFTASSFEVLIQRSNKKSLKASIGSLYKEIIPEKSTVNFSSKRINIILRKASNHPWPRLEEKDQAIYRGNNDKLKQIITEAWEAAKMQKQL
ncbi:hypothetical protein RHGRI_029087 [Rhododendron griersonianum]|uniref:CS domain-containing protein n=1 Tax=Rhododendron griersonianum TaxID=479676 RepID=A0AAV6ILS1_9ERIC|nr:hypothetical protein RHGRI_029087 [Rhododendron griersonianum]